MAEQGTGEGAADERGRVAAAKAEAQELDYDLAVDPQPMTASDEAAEADDRSSGDDPERERWGAYAHSLKGGSAAPAGVFLTYAPTEVEAAEIGLEIIRRGEPWPKQPGSEPQH